MKICPQAKPPPPPTSFLSLPGLSNLSYANIVSGLMDIEVDHRWRDAQEKITDSPQTAASRPLPTDEVAWKPTASGEKEMVISVLGFNCTCCWDRSCGDCTRGGWLDGHTSATQTRIVRSLRAQACQLIIHLIHYVCSLPRCIQAKDVLAAGLNASCPASPPTSTVPSTLTPSLYPRHQTYIHPNANVSSHPLHPPGQGLHIHSELWH